EKPGGYTYEELAELALNALPKARSVLLICNTKNQAARLFALLQHTDAAVFHLSTSMCMAHRQDTLQSITDALAQTDTQVICVATQLVEAGVDFSFGCVVRVLAGLDNLIQAAGRCNRHGEFGFLCPVYVVNLKGEDLTPLPEIMQAQNAARALLEAFRQNPAGFGGELDSQEAIAFYYHNLFQNMRTQAQDYPVSKENFTLFSLLSDNATFRRQKTLLFPLLGQAFQTAGQAFTVFGQTGCDVLVPYGEGKALIEELGSKFSLYDTARQKELLKKARRFSVTFFEYQRSRLEKAGGLAPLCGGTVLALLPAFYLDNTGLTLALGYNSFLEVQDDL
ncbi:MAG: helicase-related protein, partial [Oscillospiraceae bacterium]